MIEKALSYVTNRLNEYLSHELGLDEKIVVLSNLLNEHDRISSSRENKVIVTLVNIEQESSLKDFQTTPTHSQDAIKANPPLLINCYILIATSFVEVNYRSGLAVLSSIIQFFHDNSIIHQNNSTGLDPELEKLTVELYDLSFEQLNNLWSALGCKYMPSILYKIRLISTSDREIRSQLPEVRPADQEPKD